MMRTASSLHRRIVTRATWLVFLSALGAAAQTPRQIAQTAFQAVVLVVMEDAQGHEVSLGSGFFVQPGVIVTNFHVIGGASKGYVRLIGQRQPYAIQRIIGMDREHDLALLQIAGSSASPLPLGESQRMAVGDTVYVVGNPQGLEGTFSDGLISGIRHIGSTTLFQITAPISPGSSGGPVFNTLGQVIGVAVGSFKGGGQNLNFAIPSFYVSALLHTPPPPPLSSPAPPVSRPDTTPSARDAPAMTVGPQTYSESLTGMAFVWVPAGCFPMGCGAWTAECDQDERPIHHVCVDGFWMGKTEVTQGQWKTIMGTPPPAFRGDTYPVEWVSWYEAQTFLKHLNAHTQGKALFRLPTETEWEYACRSGGKPEKYAGSGTPTQVAWYLSNSGNTLHPVGLKSPNGLRLHDMSGNVAEWCEDTYDQEAFHTHQRHNPVSSVGTSRVVRGGGYGFSARGVRCGNRYNNFDPATGYGSIGFRIVRQP